MSAPLLPDDVLFLQRMLSASGHYSGPRDGIWSHFVDDAEAQLHEIAESLTGIHGRVDARSERHLRTLLPAAQNAARQFLRRLRDAGVDARIVSGTRSYAEQDALYRIGRFGDRRPVVTNARGGESRHNFGIAWDIGIFQSGNYLSREAPYEAAARLRPDGVEWGGTCETFRDAPHFHVRVDASLEAIRDCFEGGRQFL
jgi:peptidoglycan L-alanyl-D-glutamate endopeptidase CwlK